MEIQASMTGCQKLISSYKCFKLSVAVAIATFEMYGLKILRLSHFNMLFQLVPTKFFKSKLFSCSPKVEHVMTVMQSAYQFSKREGLFTLYPVQGSGGTPSLR